MDLGSSERGAGSTANPLGNVEDPLPDTRRDVARIMHPLHKLHNVGDSSFAVSDCRPMGCEQFPTGRKTAVHMHRRQSVGCISKAQCTFDCEAKCIPRIGYIRGRRSLKSLP